MAESLLLLFAPLLVVSEHGARAYAHTGTNSHNMT